MQETTTTPAQVTTTIFRGGVVILAPYPTTTTTIVTRAPSNPGTSHQGDPVDLVHLEEAYHQRHLQDRVEVEALVQRNDLVVEGEKKKKKHYSTVIMVPFFY